MKTDEHAKVYNEIEDVKQALEHADENGLIAEFVWSALLSAREGNSIQTAIEHALIEWDL